MNAIPLFSSEADLSRKRSFVAAMTVLAAVSPSLHTIAVTRGIIWTYQVRTGATDGVFIYINPDYFEGLKNDSQRAFLIGHEVLHIVLKHLFRARLFKDRGFFSSTIRWCHNSYNAAADYIINAMLVKMGLELAEGGLISDEFTANDIAEEVYVKILKEAEDQPEPEGDQPGDESSDSDDDSDSSGESDESGDSDDESGEDSDDSDEDGDESDGDDDSDDGESGDEGDSGGDDQDGDPTDDESGTGNPVPSDHDGHDEHFEPRYDGNEAEQEQQRRSDDAEIQRDIDEAIEQGEREGENIDGNLRSATRQNDEPVDILDHDWEELLENYLQQKSSNGRDDWSRINRRQYVIQGIVGPSKKGSLQRLALIKDISYSVSNHSLNVFDAKIAELLDQVQPDSGTLVLHTHTAVEQADDVYSGDEYLEIERPRGGGTYMSAGLDWIEENGESPDLTICFTDSDVWGDDLDRLAEAGVLLVIDTYESYVYAKSEILRSGIEFIVVNDRPA